MVYSHDEDPDGYELRPHTQQRAPRLVGEAFGIQVWHKPTEGFTLVREDKDRFSKRQTEESIRLDEEQAARLKRLLGDYLDKLQAEREAAEAKAEQERQAKREGAA